MEIEYIDIDELNYFEGNPRKRTKKVLDHLIKSIKEFGFAEPVVLWENCTDFDYPENTILGGHRRVDALRWLIENENWKDRLVPCIKVAVGSVAKAKALNIALNKIGEKFDKNLLYNWLEEIRVDDIDIDITGFDNIELEDIRADVNSIKPSDFGHELPNMRILKEMPLYQGKGYWEMPELREDMLGDIYNEDIATYVYDLEKYGLLDKSTTYLYIWGKTRKIKEETLKNYKFIPCFFTYDQYFEGVWLEPHIAIARMINMGFDTTMMTDFSLWNDLPKPMRYFNAYRNRCLARYMQDAGLKVIPVVSWAFEDDFDFLLENMPVGAPMIGWSIQTFLDNEIDKYKIGIRKLVDKLKPKKLLVYGEKYRKEIISDLDNVIFVYSRGAIVSKLGKLKKGGDNVKNIVNLIGSGGGGGGEKGGIITRAGRAIRRAIKRITGR